MKILISLLLFSIVGCMTSNRTAVKTQTSDEKEFTPQFNRGHPTLIYKTSSNYKNLVPILLSDDKSEIVSYPHPTDLIVGSGYALPTILNNDYLLDNRGINKNVAFLKLTYEDYAKLQNAPGLKELYSLIIDKNPLIELCDCGNKNAFTNIEVQLNKLIDSNILRSKCNTIK
jgi:hypothetical protein